MYLHQPALPPGRAAARHMVVSMRPIPAERVADAATISGRYPAVHGAPVHVGAPEALGIADLGRPDFGDPVRRRARRGPGVLGLRGDAAGGGDGLAACRSPSPMRRGTCSSPTFPIREWHA